jgi:hypothetical protein
MTSLYFQLFLSQALLAIFHAVPQPTPRFLLAGLWATMAVVNLALAVTQ